MTEAAIIFSRGVRKVGAPAREATSASPVASITRLARIASRPAFGFGDDADDRVAVHDRCDKLAVEHRRDAGLFDQAVGDELEAFGIEFVGQRLRFRHGGAHRLARSSNSRPMPLASTVFSWRYQAKPSTPTTVMLPPKQPKRSTSATSTPARAAANAADKSAGTGADDEDIGFMDDGRMSGGFGDRLCGHGPAFELSFGYRVIGRCRFFRQAGGAGDTPSRFARVVAGIRSLIGVAICQTE